MQPKYLQSLSENLLPVRAVYIQNPIISQGLRWRYPLPNMYEYGFEHSQTLPNLLPSLITTHSCSPFKKLVQIYKKIFDMSQQIF